MLSIVQRLITIFASKVTSTYRRTEWNPCLLFDLSGDCGTSLITRNEAVEIISLDGVASGALFDGVVEPYGTNVQLIDEGGQRHIFSRYILKGHDKNGVPTRIFVENEGWFSGATGRAF